MRAILLVAALLPMPLWAQITPTASRDDPRVQTVRFEANQPVRVQTSPGDDVTVMLAPGERISSFDISNNAVYQVTLSEARDSFILHTSMVLYRGAPASSGTISFVSGLRSYRLLLSSAQGAGSPYVLRFTYAGSERGRGRSATRDPSQYKLTGNKELRPASIRDDGSKTYIQWNADQVLPAVFALDRLGREEMVDGYMRSGTFTIDRVHERLVFRIDNAKAEAARPKRRSSP